MKLRTVFFTLGLFYLPILLQGQHFPSEWVGTWKGKLYIYTLQGLTDSVQMEVEIYPLDTSSSGRYTFGIAYGSRGTDWRPYELVPVAPKHGLWKIDEKNGIVIESFLYGPKLMSWFSVMNSQLLCTYERVGEDLLLFEAYSSAYQPISTSGNTEWGGEKIPEVNTYGVKVFQRATLKKQL